MILNNLKFIKKNSLVENEMKIVTCIKKPKTILLTVENTYNVNV